MPTDAKLLVWSAILTWLMLLTAFILRCRGWTPEGLQIALGNREGVPEGSSLAGRAERAARNMLENMVLFIAIAAAVRFAGKTGSQADFGAMLFFWARVVYWPIYLAGIIYLRTLAWTVSIVGLGIMIAALV